jgi:hypothetical protein
MKLTIIDTARHRNGICGAPFAVVLFKDSGTDGSRKVAILFDGQYHCAVLDVAKLAAGDIAFMSNSWRGDQYEPSLRKAIEESPPAEPPETDIDALLAGRKQIAVIWSIEDEQEVRPDLSEDQCWDVLKSAKHDHDATLGINWDVLECHAQMLFGDAPEADEVEEE